LLEAKWTKEPIGHDPVDAFDYQIKHRTLDNTLGLFVSISGFSPSAIKAHSGRRTSVLLMDGNELLQVLREEQELAEMLNCKIKNAARRGEQ
jgi:restriction endonuclease Mrr